MYHKVEEDFFGRTLSLEAGEIAKQAGGSVIVAFNVVKQPFISVIVRAYVPEDKLFISSFIMPLDHW